MARQRRPRAIQVRGGRWIRPPRPKPKPRPPEKEAQRDELQHDDMGYESCETGGSDMLLKSLIAAAQPTIQLLLSQGETDAAGSVQALCDFMEAKEEGHARLKRAHARCRSKLSDARDKVIGKENLQGQNIRYWQRIQRLQRQLFQARYHSHARRQWFPP